MTDDFVVKRAGGRRDAMRQEGLASGQNGAATDDFVVRKAFGRRDALRQEGLASGQKSQRTDASHREGRRRDRTEHRRTT